jgi:2-polyprenyl-3-methyl-5-hydroxy-6-metoxy-1,4-benzoquinol methylase
MSQDSGAVLERCAVCGGSAIRSWFATDFGAIGRCAGCGQVLRADRPNRQDVVRLHQTTNIHVAPYAALGDQARDELDFYDRFLDLCHREHPGGRVLDVGCGMGEFLLAAQARGFSLMGIEPVDECRAIAAQRSGCAEIVETPLEETEFASESLSAVAMWDVIEHLVDPRLALARVRRALRPNGLLGVATINHASLMYDVFHVMRRVAPALARPLSPRLFVPYHTYYFTMASLARLVREVGFEIVEQRGYEFPLSRLEAGAPMKTALRGLYVAQKLCGRQSEQYIFARRKD